MKINHGNMVFIDVFYCIFRLQYVTPFLSLLKNKSLAVAPPYLSYGKGVIIFYTQNSVKIVR